MGQEGRVGYLIALIRCARLSGLAQRPPSRPIFAFPISPGANFWTKCPEKGVAGTTDRPDHATIVWTQGVLMSDCLHCDIHEMLESHLQSEQADLAAIAAS